MYNTRPLNKFFFYIIPFKKVFFYSLSFVLNEKKSIKAQKTSMLQQGALPFFQNGIFLNKFSCMADTGRSFDELFSVYYLDPFERLDCYL